MARNRQNRTTGECPIKTLSKPRLSAQLLSTTWQQTEMQMQEDLRKMKDWSNRFSTMAAKQAHCFRFFEPKQNVA